MTSDVKMQMMSYDIICAKIVIDSDRRKYNINTSYLASYVSQKMTKLGNNLGDFKL